MQSNSKITMSITRELQTTGATPVASRLTVSRGTVNEKKSLKLVIFATTKQTLHPLECTKNFTCAGTLFLQFKKCFVSLFLRKKFSATFLPSIVFLAGSKPTPEQYIIKKIDWVVLVYMIHPIKIKLVLGLENKKKEDRLVLSEDFF